MRYKSISDYIRNNMENLHGEFTITATDLSEKEEGCILTTIHPRDKDGETADFILYTDGREEYTNSI